MGYYLVTGGAGFIGSAIIRRLLSEQHSVVTIDNLSTGVRENVPEGCEFIVGNDYDSEVLALVPNKDKIDAIYHIAGQSSGEISFENPVYDLQTNTQSTLMLLQMANTYNIHKFIYASSMSVYGDIPSEFVNEETITCPKSFYAVGKLASEHYMRIYSAIYGIECVSFRFFNVYGIGQNLSNLKQGMASIYLAMAIKDKHIGIKGSGDRFRDFVYIDDVVDAVCAVRGRSCPNVYSVYNVCSGTRHTVSQVVDTICRELPYVVTYEFLPSTPGDQHGIYGDNAKIRCELGWKPKYEFDRGMKAMVAWAQKTLLTE